MADYDIGEAFRRIEEIMIESMSRNLRHHIKLEEDEGINYTQWQAEQLAALKSFQKQNKSLFKDYFSTIDNQIDKVLRRAYSVGGMEQETSILKALKKGWQPKRTAGSTVSGEFFRKNDRKLNALIKATQQDIQRAEIAMLRTVDDRYRKIIFNSHVRYQSGAGTLAQCVDMATKDFLAQGINCIEYADGKRVGIDSYAAMALRTAHTRAYLQGEAAKRDEWGINTVIVNKRGVACPRCLKYVGMVFYDDVWGTVPIKDSKYPLLSEAIKGGLYHPNCKDIHTTYFEGVNTSPQPMTAEQKEEARRVYNLEQEQRYNERQIRYWKRLESSSVYPENQAIYKQYRENWQERQRQFISNNGDVLKRRYENERYTGMKLPEPPGYKMSRKPEGATWGRKGENITPAENRLLKEYAQTKGVILKGTGQTDVDVELVKEMINTASEMTQKFPALTQNPQRPFTIKVVNGMADGDFAEVLKSQSNVIRLNANAFRDKQRLASEYAKKADDGWFVRGTNYHAIIYHESGHILTAVYKVDGLAVAKRILKMEQDADALDWITDNLSEYAAWNTDGSEILSEVLSAYMSGKRTEFVLKFLSECGIL